MTNEEFITLCHEQFDRRMLIMSNSKKARTAGGDDRLIQFKRQAYLHQKSTGEVCLDLCTKQFTDLIDVVRGTLVVGLDYTQELISDIQNYLDLLNALLVEDSQEDSSTAVILGP